MEDTLMEDTPKHRYEDVNPNRRQDGCLFNKCDDHGEWKERLKTLDSLPSIISWINSVKKIVEELPDVIHWVDQKKGGEFQSRLIIGAVIVVILSGFMSTAWMFKGDVTTNLNAFKLESTERINIFKAEMSERQAALKLEISERQRVYEENAKDQNATYTLRINTIVDSVNKIETQMGILTRLNEQFQKQVMLNREEDKELIRDLKNTVTENKAIMDSKKK